MANKFGWAKDQRVFSRAVEELRAERADLNDVDVIKARYIKLGGKVENPVAAAAAPRAPRAPRAPKPPKK